MPRIGGARARFPSVTESFKCLFLRYATRIGLHPTLQLHECLHQSPRKSRLLSISKTEGVLRRIAPARPSTSKFKRNLKLTPNGKLPRRSHPPLGGMRTYPKRMPHGPTQLRPCECVRACAYAGRGATRGAGILIRRAVVCSPTYSSCVHQRTRTHTNTRKHAHARTRVRPLFRAQRRGISELNFLNIHASLFPRRFRH